MIARRLVATSFDLFIAFLSAWIAGILLEYDIRIRIHVALALYLFHTSVVLLTTKRNTIGEHFLGIELVSHKDQRWHIEKSLISQFLYCLILYLVLTSSGAIDGLMMMFLLVVVYVPIFMSNKFNQSMSGVDHLLGTFYRLIETTDPERASVS